MTLKERVEAAVTLMLTGTPDKILRSEIHLESAAPAPALAAIARGLGVKFLVDDSLPKGEVRVVALRGTKRLDLIA